MLKKLLNIVEWSRKRKNSQEASPKVGTGGFREGI
jgi:hypothetical protein